MTRVCPGAVGQTWMAGRETPSSLCPISKASLGSLAHLKSASVSVVWDVRRKFKDLRENTWKLSWGIFLAGACVIFFPGWRGREARWAGLFFTLRIVQTNQEFLTLLPTPCPTIQRQTFPTSLRNRLENSKGFYMLEVCLFIYVYRK